MPGTVIGKKFNLGYVGTVSRQVDYIIDNRTVYDGSEEIAFGTPVILRGDNTYVGGPAALSGITAANFGGIAAREVRQATAYESNTGGYKAQQRIDVITKGAVTVEVKNPQAVAFAAGGPVYVRTAVSASYPAAKVGDFETAADSGKTILLANVKLTTGYVDTNGVAEVTILTRQNP
jgi:hypothetical protein